LAIVVSIVGRLAGSIAVANSQSLVRSTEVTT
jgi:hypothetical protein